MNQIKRRKALNLFSVRRKGYASARLILFAALFQPTVGATEPDAALSYRSPDFVEAEQEVVRAEAELQRAYLGLSTSLEVTPSLEYSEDLVIPADAPTLGLGVEARASVGYTYDQPGILLETIELLQAKERLQDAEREGVRAALMAHTDVLSAQLALQAERESLDADKRNLEDVEVRFEAGEATETELAMAQLEVDSGQRSFTSTQRTVQDVVGEAARYNLSGPLRFRPLMFVLPETTPEATFTYRIAELELRRTEAFALQDTVFGVVDNIYLGTRYVGDDYELSSGINLDQGTPSVGASVRYLDRDPEAWTVTLEATLRLDDDTSETFSEAQRDVEEARAHLDELSADFAEDLRDARDEAVSSWQSVEVSGRNFELLGRRIKELEAQIEVLPDRLDRLREDLEGVQRPLDVLRAQRDAETNAEEQQALDRSISDFEGRITSLETELQEAEEEGSDAQQALDQLRFFYGQEEGDLLLDWTDYVSAVDTYLSLAEASWQAVLK